MMDRAGVLLRAAKGRKSLPMSTPGLNPWRFSVAPMMEWTDRYCRAFHRHLSRHALLYSEMVAANAVIHGPRERLIGFDSLEQPVALQLGGNDPKALAAAARIGADWGYAEINLNCGCPSDRVQGGAFGACLMREPLLVAECVAAMKAEINIPVTVKCRLGVDEQDIETALDAMADAVFAAGCDALIVHARKAWLKGLSPKDNRTIPPLDYDRVHRLKARLPNRIIAINGGIETLHASLEQLDYVDGVMLGRAAYHQPDLLLSVDPLLFGDDAPFADAFAALDAYEIYIAHQLEKGVPLHAIPRLILGLFAGRRGARAFRRHLSTEGVKPGAGLDILRSAVALVSRETDAQDAA